MQTILSPYFAYIATLFFFQHTKIISDTIGPLEKSRPWTWAVISGDHTLSSGQKQPEVEVAAAAVFLWVQYNNPATHNHYYHCSCGPVSGQIMQTWLSKSENLHTIKPDWITHIYTRSLFFCNHYQIGNLFTSCASNNVSMCRGYRHCAAKEKFPSTNSCT